MPRAFRVSPATRIAERFVQNSVCLASALKAALWMWRTTLRFARASTASRSEMRSRVRFQEPSLPGPGKLSSKLAGRRGLESQGDEAPSDDFQCDPFCALASGRVVLAGPRQCRAVYGARIDAPTHPDVES